MSVHFYRDDCGAVGDRDDGAMVEMIEAREEADEARRDLMSSAEALLALCDRHDGDSGDDASLIYCLAAEVDALASRIRAALGEPRVMRDGSLVPVGARP